MVSLPAQFELIRELGRGGMASVYLVFDKARDEQVALKKLAAEHVANLNTLLRFSKEFEVLEGLSHPNIVKVFEFFDLGSGNVFMTMEYIEGESLSSKIGKSFEEFPFLARIEVAAQISAALSFAHAQGLVHRDLKPANVLINKEGQAKLVDFGVARLRSDSLSLTKTGDMVGTPHYMAPEQIRNEEIDQRTDIYSFGALSYELFSGTRPFEHETLFEVTRAHLIQDPQELRSFNKEIPRWLERMVAICLEKDPANRYQSIDEVAELLQAKKNEKETKGFFARLLGEG